MDPITMDSKVTPGKAMGGDSQVVNIVMIPGLIVSATVQ